MAKHHASLTGSWSGAYRYPGDRGETVFNAQIEEVGGAFTGAIQEPNLFLASSDTVLRADIEGVRNAREVSFTKFYDHSDIAHAVRYEGLADEALARIEGRWIIRSDWSGAFFMTRDDLGEAAEAEAAAEAQATTRT
jgi:hypothetical protein